MYWLLIKKKLKRYLTNIILCLARRGAGFPVGNDSGNILSPRSSESGIGMKMVEYVLASTPNKMEQLEPRMRSLVIVCTHYKLIVFIKYY